MTKEDLRMLHDEWGFNAVRLGVMWVAVEAVEGVINNTFLKQIRDISDTMFEHGIYTLLDGHQDLLGPDLCGEDLQWAMRKISPMSILTSIKRTRFPSPLLFLTSHVTLLRDTQTTASASNTFH